MSKTIMLAVDAARGEPGKHVAAAVDMTKELATLDDKVIVLHVHEYAYGRFGRIKVDCDDRQGEQLIAEIVGDLSQSGISASSMIREAELSHVARAIVLAATEAGARMLVLGSSTRTDLPWVPFGSVSGRVLHISQLPVLIVPMRAGGATEQSHNAEVAAPAATTG
jgi:nucleotide-binding universal stress UspA family protein